jgi:hypothetical protein
MLYLSKSIAEGNKELDPVFRWFSNHLLIPDLSARTGVSNQFTMSQFEGRTPILEKILSMLKHADLGVTGGRLVKRTSEPKEFVAWLETLPVPSQLREDVEKETRYRPELLHRGPNGVEMPLDWNSESAGTERLYALAGHWLGILQNGRTVCIDELETSMHPLMVRELLRLFFSEKENPKGAQIIFTTHNPLLLDPTLLRRDQVWFTDKDDEGVAHLYPLTDYQPRKGESLARGYLAGRYGGVPFIPKGLLGSFPDHELALKAGGRER